MNNFFLPIPGAVPAWLCFNYPNASGVRQAHKVAVVAVEFGSNKSHPEPQWFVRGLELGMWGEDTRLFAMREMRNFAHG